MAKVVWLASSKRADHHFTLGIVLMVHPYQDDHLVCNTILPSCKVACSGTNANGLIWITFGAIVLLGPFCIFGVVVKEHWVRFPTHLQVSLLLQFSDKWPQTCIAYAFRLRKVLAFLKVLVKLATIVEVVSAFKRDSGWRAVCLDTNI